MDHQGTVLGALAPGVPRYSCACLRCGPLYLNGDFLGCRAGSPMVLEKELRRHVQIDGSSSLCSTDSKTFNRFEKRAASTKRRLVDVGFLDHHGDDIADCGHFGLLVLRNVDVERQLDRRQQFGSINHVEMEITRKIKFVRDIFPTARPGDDISHSFRDRVSKAIRRQFATEHDRSNTLQRQMIHRYTQPIQHQDFPHYLAPLGKWKVTKAMPTPRLSSLTGAARLSGSSEPAGTSTLRGGVSSSGYSKRGNGPRGPAGVSFGTMVKSEQTQRRGRGRIV
jgi:hypothetical protein